VTTAADPGPRSRFVWLSLGGSGRDRVAQVLAHVAVRRLLGAFACLMVGEWALIAAVSVHAYRAGGAVAVGLLGLRFLPAAAAGLAAPRLIERRQPARILRLVGTARALCIGGVAIGLAIGFPYGLVIALLALDGAVAALYRPAQSALLPSLLSTPGQLTAAAGLLGNVKTLSQVIGALVGGLLVVATSAAAVGAAAAALMAIGAGLVPHRAARVEALTGRSRPRADPATRRAAINVAALATVRSLIRGLWLALVVVVAIRLVHLGGSGVGVLMAASAAGTIIAVPITMSLIGSARLGAGLGAALATAGAPLAALAAWHAPAIALGLIAVHGVGMAVAEAASLGILHRLLDSRGVSSLVGPMESAKLGLEGAGCLLAPVLLLVAGTRGALVVAGALPLVLVALDWRALGRIDAAATARTRLVDLLRSADVFHGLPLAGLEELAAGAEARVFGEGTEVIRQGEPGETFYTVERGRAQVSIDGYPVAVLTRGMSFGERALLRGGPRAATVVALGELAVVTVSRELFLAAVAGGQSLVVQAGSLAERSLPDVLPGLPLFGRLPRDSLRRAAALFEVADFHPADAIVRQGDRGDRFFVVLSGSVEVSVDGRPVGALMAGDGFGEIALLHDVPRRATVTARDGVRVATLGRQAFVDLVSPADSPVVA
jgi:CRP-like cAMP-binding protein